FGFEIVFERSVAGHSSAVNRMIDELFPSSTRILSIAGDLPRLVPSEIDFALDAASEPITLIPSRDWTGTNGVVFIPPARMKMEILPLQHVPEIRPGMDLSECLSKAAAASGFDLQSDDILAVTQKIVSKAEGRIVKLSSVEPSAHSASIAKRMSKDPRLVEII